MAKKSFKRDATDLFISKQEPTATAPTTEEAPGIPRGYRLVPDKRSERLQLLISPATKTAIKAKAKEEGVSVNDLINRILNEYIERTEK